MISNANSTKSCLAYFRDVKAKYIKVYINCRECSNTPPDISHYQMNRVHVACFANASLLESDLVDNFIFNVPTEQLALDGQLSHSEGTTLSKLSRYCTLFQLKHVLLSGSAFIKMYYFKTPLNIFLPVCSHINFADHIK